MSLKGSLRRLERGVRWLETEGRYRRVAIRMKTLERLQEIADRVAVDPAFAARWKRDFSYIPLPPPLRAATAPRTEDVRVPILLGVSSAGARNRLDALRAPDEGVRVGSAGEGVRVESAVEEVRVEPEYPPSPPSPDMEIRPVRWRARGAGEGDCQSGSYGRCIAEYDPLRDDDDDGDG